MSVRKRSWITSKGEAKQAWIVDYSDQAGERHLKTFEKKKDAEAYHATVRVDVHRGVHTSTRMTVAEAGAKWIADAEDRLEPATVESYRQHLSDHIVPTSGRPSCRRSPSRRSASLWIGCARTVDPPP